MVSLFCRRHWLIVLATFLAWPFSPPARAAEPATVYVLLWFDTEDYILPASDDAALHVAQFLTAEHIKGTFKVVGEKARVLERRGRKDVIEALKKHEIGYHSNWHSVQPTPAMYLSGLGWDEGVAEFDRRERPGYDDVKRIFGAAPTCYGQPGSSWAPQAYGTLQKWGVGIYLDYGLQVNLDNRPNYYCGLLNLFKLAHRPRPGLNNRKELEAAQESFQDARQKLLAEGGGIVSIVYHPCEFVHAEFWDGANFKNGANPPRDQWKLPKARTAEQTKIAYGIFEDYVRFMKRHADVQFVTASEVAGLYADRATTRKFTAAEIRQIAAAVGPDVTFQKRDDYTLAASELFALLNAYVAERIVGRDVAAINWQGTPYGPTQAVPAMTEAVTTDKSQFERTVADVADYLRKHGRVPPAVWLGGVAVPPEAYLQALAVVVQELVDGKPVPKSIEVRPAKLAAATYVADDSPDIWRWPIFPRGFQAPALMELAKRRAWTLKPALLRSDR